MRTEQREQPTVIRAKPLAEWYVIGRAVVERNFGIQERSGNRFWSAILSPLYHDLHDLDYKVDYYATCFREELFDKLEEVQDGDEVFFNAVLIPRTEFTSDGRKRGRMALRIYHLEISPSLSSVGDDSAFDFDSNDDSAVEIEEEDYDDDEESNPDPFL